MTQIDIPDLTSEQEPVGYAAPIVLNERRGAYPPRPDVDEAVTYVGRSAPTDGRDRDYWVHEDNKAGLGMILLQMLRGRSR